MIRTLVTGLTLATLAAGAVTGAASAQPVAPDYFRGKTINIVVGSGTGDGYDLYSRLLAQYMGRHIAGNPRFIVQNMPGAGTLRATNFISEVAPKDGTYFGSVGGGTATAGLLDAKNARFDARRFGWIGSMNSEVGLVLSWGTTPFKTIKDVMKQEFIVGGGGPTSGNVVFPVVLNQVVGTRFKVVGGYKGTGDIALAVERGELHGTASYHYSSIIGRNPDWLTRKQVNVLLQLSLRKHPLFPDVPLVGELGQNDEQRAILELVFARQEMGRPFMLPPGTPAGVADILRRAFDAAMRDPALIAEAEKRKMDLNQPMTGEEIHALIDRLYNWPQAIIEKAAQAAGPGAAGGG
jgi:tripartite-type tricarboxylate transporter receptor subunit TctC